MLRLPEIRYQKLFRLLGQFKAITETPHRESSKESYLMGRKEISIVKMTGEKASFNSSKSRLSLERAEASDMIISQIIAEVEGMLYDGITAKGIYKTAFALLCKSSRPTAKRYKLKKAILELGPTGHPFEKFVGEIPAHQRFNTKAGVIVKGRCINHEVDVVVEKDDPHFIVKCKFHSEQGRKCNVQVPLCIQSRLMDIIRKLEKQPGHGSKLHQRWLATNTRFSEDAIQYGNCKGLKLISRNYPKNGRLKERMDHSGTPH